MNTLSDNHIQELVERGVRPDLFPHSPAVAAERAAGAFSGNVGFVAKAMMVRAACSAVLVEVASKCGEPFCFALPPERARGVAAELVAASIAAEKDLAGLKAYQTLTQQNVQVSGAGEALLHGAGSAGYTNVRSELA